MPNVEVLQFDLDSLQGNTLQRFFRSRRRIHSVADAEAFSVEASDIAL
jgi:hypothetical protein